MELSIVIPTFRRPLQLREAIKSVLSQTGVTLEVYVIDDSPEGSAEPIVREFADSRLTYLRNPEPTGGNPSIVRNLGWPRAKGEFIHFLDDDDIVPEGHYAAVKAMFDSAPNAGVVFGRIEPFGDDPRQVQNARLFFESAGRRAARCQRFGSRWLFAACMFFQETLLVCSAAVVRRTCVGAIEGFDPKLALLEDVDFYARAIRRFDVRFMDRVALHYRIHPSLTRQARHAAFVDSFRRMHARYRAEHGFLELNALRVVSRVLRIL